MIPIATAKSLIGERIVIASESGALYEGVLSQVNRKKHKLVLTNMIIRGRHDGFIASKRDRSRWFALNRFSLYHESAPPSTQDVSNENRFSRTNQDL